MKYIALVIRVCYNGGMATAQTNRGRPRTRPRTAINRLRECRQHVGATQKQIAAYIGVSQEAVSIEEIQGDTLGTPSYYKLAELFDLDPRILEGLKDPPDLARHFRSRRKRIREALKKFSG